MGETSRMTLQDWQRSKNLSDSDILTQEFLTRIMSESDLVQCACGCGESRGRYDKRGIERRYIQGHSSRGKRFGGIEENRKDHETLYPVTVSIRLTNEINDEIPRIASFEAMKPSALCRQELLKMIRRYQRNPQYKRWLKITQKAFR